MIHCYNINLKALVKRSKKENYASELGAEGNTFLMVYNPDENNEGSYEVVVGE
jgi:hypothetical protein